MGSWLHVAFVACADLARVEHELGAALVARGRRLTRPPPRVAARYDAMQYGHGDEVPRWGVAGFAGAPGWTVLKTAPLELLLAAGQEPLLVELAQRLEATAFHYGVYDGQAHALFEVGADGRVERTGTPTDRALQFLLVDVAAAADSAEATRPGARVAGVALPGDMPSAPWVARVVAERSERLRAWLARVGAEPGEPSSPASWSAHPAAVVRELAADGSSFLGIEGVVDEAILQVFGGDNHEHCDNFLCAAALVPHTPLPISGFVLYADA